MSDTRWLIVCQSVPYEDPLAVAGLDAAMAAGAFGQPVSVLFTGRGVAQLAQELEPPGDERHIGKTIAGLPLYDIEEVFVCAHAWQTLTAPRTDLLITPLDQRGQRALIGDATHVLSF